MPRVAYLAVALALTAVVACSPSTSQTSDRSKKHSPTSAGSTSETPVASVPRPPREGDCRRLGYAEISMFSNDTPPVPCNKQHTAYTFDVKKLPSDIAFTGVQIENDAVQNFAATACRTSFAGFIGGDVGERALSRLTVTYFVPGQRAFDLGAHWVRCDVIALQSDNVLADLPRQLSGVLDDAANAARFGVCSKAEPGSPAFKLVMCTQDHTYRALAALRLGASDAPYPGEQVTKVDGRQRCQDLVSNLLGPGGGYTFGWTYPSSADWQAGQRFGYCWHKTTS